MLTQVPQIWPLADTAHYKGYYLLTYLLTHTPTTSALEMLWH